MSAIAGPILVCGGLPILAFCQSWSRPPNTEVIVSACEDALAGRVPGGQLLVVEQIRSHKKYLLNLRTGERTSLPPDFHGTFLNAELVWLGGDTGNPQRPAREPHWVVEFATGNRYPVRDLGSQANSRLENGEFNSELWVFFQTAGQVFLHHSANLAIALAPDFRENPEGNVVLYQGVLAPGYAGFEPGELLETKLNELGVKYHVTDYSLLYTGVPSPSGELVARNDGVYVSDTGTPVVRRILGGYFKAWYYDDGGIVVHPTYRFLISDPLLGTHFRIPQPILKLRLPRQQ